MTLWLWVGRQFHMYLIHEATGIPVQLVREAQKPHCCMGCGYVEAKCLPSTAGSDIKLLLLPRTSVTELTFVWTPKHLAYPVLTSIHPHPLPLTRHDLIYARYLFMFLWCFWILAWTLSNSPVKFLLDLSPPLKRKVLTRPILESNADIFLYLEIPSDPWFWQ